MRLLQLIPIGKKLTNLFYSLSAGGLLLLLSSCEAGKASGSETYPVVKAKNETELIEGVSFVGSPHPCQFSDFDSVVAVGANYVSLMPFAYGQTAKANLIYGSSSWQQWWGESMAGVDSCISMAAKYNIKAMIKPQLWIDRGTFTGIFKLENEKDWIQFEKQYSAWIVSFAELSEKHKLELFCIATELDTWAEMRPDYWRGLIAEIRKVFHGKLVYACNWGHEKTIPFWADLDFIGVDAYYPLSESQTPTVEELLTAWKKVSADLSALSALHHKKILFTEWGYQCRDYCTKDPWVETEDMNMNFQAQSNCYEALLENCSKEHWFAGGFIWKWFPHNGHEPTFNREKFSPQERPALTILKKYYGG
jgi:hypothetical protein